MRNFKFLFVAMAMVSLFMFAGCSPQETTPPGSGATDRSMTDYSFVEVTNSCIIQHDVDLTNESGYCTGDFNEYAMFFTPENNWSVMCCDFTNKCNADTQAVTDYDDICADGNEGKYTGYLFSDDGYWMAQCCDNNGGSCYVDLEVDPANETTVCNEEYHQNTYGMNFNGTTWEAMCCIGGLEE